MAAKLHFLVVTFPFQGHINPALRLAARLAATAAVTFSTTIPAHRRMFPSSSPPPPSPITFAPFSDGSGNIDVPHPRDNVAEYMANLKTAVHAGVLSLIDAAAAAGAPVSCVVYTMLVPWAAGAARARGVPSAHYWIQPASVFAVYYHYLHGHRSIIDAHAGDPGFVVELPGLPPMAIRDLPSFIFATDPADVFHCVYQAFADGFDALDADAAGEGKATVLVNALQELESDALQEIGYNVLYVAAIDGGGGSAVAGSLFSADEEKKYMEWLDTKPAMSVVYVAFGSLSPADRDKLSNILGALSESRRPYLWVVRKDMRAGAGDGAGVDLDAAGRGEGLIVEWCDQLKVLAHPAVGCFVTHCGWNSVLESLAAGVPMVGVPKLSDQFSNARLIEKVWGVGVRADVREGGMVRKEELGRCIEMVIGGGERAGEIRRRAAEWRRIVKDAVGEGGASDRNLTAFVEGIRSLAK